jgi:hypothetical protein
MWGILLMGGCDHAHVHAHLECVCSCQCSDAATMQLSLHLTALSRTVASTIHLQQQQRSTTQLQHSVVTPAHVQVAGQLSPTRPVQCSSSTFAYLLRPAAPPLFLTLTGNSHQVCCCSSTAVPLCIPPPHSATYLDHVCLMWCRRSQVLPTVGRHQLTQLAALAERNGPQPMHHRLTQ